MSLAPPQMPTNTDGETRYFDYTLTLSPLSHPANTSFPARLAYTTYGIPSHPAVMMPSCYGGKLASTTPFLYNRSSCQNPTSEPPVPSTKYYIIVVALLGGGESSSPSNAPEPWFGADFPKVTYEDNIHLQKALCDHLGVKKLFLYTGFSMGGQQTYHMSVLYPEFVERMACIAGSARTSWHNYSFLEGPKAALLASADFHGGRYYEHGLKNATQGTQAFGRVYSTWALDQEWYRQRCWEREESGSHPSLEEYLQKEWAEGLGSWDANDLLCLLWTWQNGDVAAYNEASEEGKGKRLKPREGELKVALDKIKAKCLIMPSKTDTYFPPRDNELEVEEMNVEQKGKAKFVVIPSIFGHLAGGGGGTIDDEKFICEEIGKFIKETS